MAYIIQPGIVNVSGPITAAEMNDLANNPFTFTTPQNFCPIGFNIKPTAGTSQPVFTSPLLIWTVSINRPLFYGSDPANVDFYTVFGLRNTTLPGFNFTEALNIDFGENNFQLIPEDGTNPTAGDYEYFYNLYGYVLL